MYSNNLVILKAALVPRVPFSLHNINNVYPMAIQKGFWTKGEIRVAVVPK